MNVVTVHRGARDNFQVARALSEANMLEALVTDFYWPADRGWAQAFERLAPRAAKMLRLRTAPGVPSRSVTTCAASGLYSQAVQKVKRASSLRQRDAVRRCDRELGRRAGRIATARGAALLSYSYYAGSAFAHYHGDQPRMLFQLHPHPASVRTILERERALWPECAASLDYEWELALPEEEFRSLTEEPAQADHCLVASTFTKETLIENGVPAERIDVIPYGIDLERFAPSRDKAVDRTSGRRPVRLLFVGTLAQRKGVKYLLDAVNLLPPGAVELTLCGRSVDDLSLFENSRAAVTVRCSVTSSELIEAYRTADVFVFPSLAEGFGHVLLEAMASGLPIISTARTAAPDLIRPGEEGLLVPPADSTALAGAIEYFASRPEAISAMGQAARTRAEVFTWQRFRTELAAAVRRILRQSAAVEEREPCFSL